MHPFNTTTDVDGVLLYWKREDHQLTPNNRLRPNLTTYSPVPDKARKQRVLPSGDALVVPPSPTPRWLFVD